MCVDIAAHIRAVAGCLGTGWTVHEHEPQPGQGERRVMLNGPDAITVTVRGPRAGYHGETGKLVFTVDPPGSASLTAGISHNKSPEIIARELRRRLIDPYIAPTRASMPDAP